MALKQEYLYFQGHSKQMHDLKDQHHRNKLEANIHTYAVKDRDAYKLNYTTSV